MVLGRIWRGIVQGAVFAVFGVGVVVLLLWLAGKFSPKVSPDDASSAKASETQGLPVPVRLIQLPVSETAIGTVRAVHETTIGSKLLARVIEVDLLAGQKVKAGDVLVRLDDTDLRARLQQANSAVASAEAIHAQAIREEKRYAELYKKQAASQQAYEKAMTDVRSSKAELDRAKEAVKEVQNTLDWATVRSPLDGTVIDKKVNVGDMVTQGQPLVTLYDPTHMQLIATVREALTGQLQLDQPVAVKIEGMGKICTGTVSEIVPEANSASRSSLVKVRGPCPPGIHSGMFGRIWIPLREKEPALVIPSRAVREVGQLKLVDVLVEGRSIRRSIREGRALTENEVKLFPELLQAEPYLVVVAGLSQGEQVVLPEAPREARHD